MDGAMTDRPAAQEALLEVRDMRVSFAAPHGMIRAVQGVDLSLARGRTLGLVGESGSGKSVLARALMRLLPPTALISAASRVGFDGTEVTALPERALRRWRGPGASMVFQDPMTALNPVMTVGAQVREVLSRHLGLRGRAAQARTEELLDQVGLPQPALRARQHPHQLSGGMRQRAAIAIALAAEPKLLIADEPTTALDVTVQAEILDLLARLQRERNMAMILITHDMGVVARCADEVAVMYAGRIVERAAAPPLFRAPRHPYSAALLASIPRLDDPPHRRLDAIPGRPPSLVAPPPGCAFAPRCAHAAPACAEGVPPLAPLGAGRACACRTPLPEDIA
ncbi:ABC transporter ATP-binding protein [Rhodovulum sp. DZ06]|uniref:ABC transporter ATP-binding protein n=1 Tax=Rhodovulum sp. DZ06 TaxID=3425126 RepID=UPI003D34545B